MCLSLHSLALFVSRLLSAEGFEPVTLVSPSPPRLPWSFMTRASLLFSVLPLSPSFSPPLSLLLSFSQGHCFSICGLPEQISALKCLLRLFSLTLLIILCSHDNSPLVSHLEFISFSPPHPSQLQKKKLRQEQFSYLKNVENAFDAAAHWYVTLGLAWSQLWKDLDKCVKQNNRFSVSYIVRNRNNHYTLCVWRYPGCCECCVLFGGREHFHNFVVIFESGLN